jgi:hypothetical protein
MPGTAADSGTVRNSGGGFLVGTTILEIANLEQTGGGVFLFTAPIITGNVSNTSGLMRVVCDIVQGNVTSGAGQLLLESNLPPGGTVTGIVASPWFVTRAVPFSLASFTVSSPTPTIQFTGLPAYPSYRVTFYGLILDASADIGMQVSTDGGATWVALGYYGSTNFSGSDGISYGSWGSQPNYFELCPFTDSAIPASGSATLQGMNNPAAVPQMNAQAVASRTGVSFVNNSGYSVTGLAGGANAIQLMLSLPGNFTAGYVEVFGAN